MTTLNKNLTAPVIDRIIRDVCETDPADYKEPSTVCINVDDLRLILESHIAAPAPHSGEATPDTPTLSDDERAAIERVLSYVNGEPHSEALHALLRRTRVSAAPIGEAGGVVAIAHEYQHEETGRMTAINEVQRKEGWAEANSRWHYVGPLYRHAAQPQAAPSELSDALAEIERLNAIINTPQSGKFLHAVSIEAEHQRQRWGAEGDAGKTPADWLWLVGYLAGKALHAHAAGNTEKAEHHIITTAAALENWHLNIFGKTDMRPGHGEEKFAAASAAGSRA